MKFFLFLFVILFSFNLKAQDTTKPLKPLWTIDQVKQIAKKYGFEDSVTSPRFRFLLYLDKVKLEKHLKTNGENLKKNKEWSDYLTRTKFVRTFEDHAKLVDAYPTVRAALVKAYEGEDKYKLYLLSAQKYKWRIYCTPKGSLTFFRADEPISSKEAGRGMRIDTLPRK